MKRIKQINHLPLFSTTFSGHALAGYSDKVGRREKGERERKVEGENEQEIRQKKGLPTPINELKIVLHSFNCE